MRRILVAVLALTAVWPAAAGVYKCTDAKGRVAYQAAPCPAGAAAAVTIRESEPPPAPADGVPSPEVAPAGSSPQEQSDLLAKQAREADKNARLRQIDRDIARAETRISEHRAALDAEMARLRAEQSRARNNLAGATYYQGLATEMQAVTNKYDSLIRAEQEHITRLRADETRVRDEK